MIRRQFKIVVIGDPAVGKTSLLEQFVNAKFSALYKPTIGMDFMCKEVTTQKFIAKLQIWDTAGQEQTKSVGVAYYRGADACLLVYDVGSSESLQSLTKWKENFVQQVGEDHPLFLVGNKIDREFEVTEENIKQMAEQLNVPDEHCFRCSAKLGSNVQQLFNVIADECCQRCKDEQDIQIPESFAISIADEEYALRNGEKCCGCCLK